MLKNALLLDVKQRHQGMGSPRRAGHALPAPDNEVHQSFGQKACKSHPMKALWLRILCKASRPASAQARDHHHLGPKLLGAAIKRGPDRANGGCPTSKSPLEQRKAFGPRPCIVQGVQKSTEEDLDLSGHILESPGHGFESSFGWGISY